MRHQLPTPAAASANAVHHRAGQRRAARRPGHYNYWTAVVEEAERILDETDLPPGEREDMPSRLRNLAQTLGTSTVAATPALAAEALVRLAGVV